MKDIVGTDMKKVCELANDLVQFYSPDGWVQVDTVITGRRRWVVEMESVYKHKKSGRHFRLCYDWPATECQEFEPFNETWNKPEFVEVEHVEVRTKKWVPVNS